MEMFDMLKWATEVSGCFEHDVWCMQVEKRG